LNSSADTIHGSVFETARLHPDRIALMHRRGGQYVGVSYADLAQAVGRAAAKLSALGVGRGDVVGILSPNRPEWIVADLAVLSLGGIVVPIYHTLPPDQLRYIISDSGMRVLLAGDAGLQAKADAVQREAGCLDQVLSLDGPGFRLGDGAAAGDPVPPVAPDVAPSDPATIVYTSGTTGEPKGVVLTHGNLVSNARGLISRYGITPDDSAVSYLPLAHMFERTCGHYVFLFAGGTIAYAQGLATVVEDVAAVRPTVLIAVPRVLEKLHRFRVVPREKGELSHERGVPPRSFPVGLVYERFGRAHERLHVPVIRPGRDENLDQLEEHGGFAVYPVHLVFENLETLFPPPGQDLDCRLAPGRSHHGEGACDGKLLRLLGVFHAFVVAPEVEVHLRNVKGGEARKLSGRCRDDGLEVLDSLTEEDAAVVED